MSAAEAFEEEASAQVGEFEGFEQALFRRHPAQDPDVFRVVRAGFGIRRHGA